MKPWGVFGRPYLDLSARIDTSGFAEMDREITLGLARVETRYTGGSLKWMGVVAPWQIDDGYRDLMDAVRAMSPGELRDLVELADDPEAIDLARPDELAFGDETDHPLNAAQARLLAVRHGVYFPWKASYHFVENDRWEDKHSGAGKSFGDEARRVFPRTVAFIESLPFVEVGRAVLFGVEPNDHAPFHRDTEPGSGPVAQSVSFAPRPGKRFALQNRADDEPLVIDAPVYWFNDMDYHGVLADPFFRYSIRVDGRFDPAFVKAIERDARSR
jgi:hypothetical protein